MLTSANRNILQKQSYSNKQTANQNVVLPLQTGTPQWCFNRRQGWTLKRSARNSKPVNSTARLWEITIMSVLFGLDEVQDEASQDIVAAVRAGILLCLCLCKWGLPVLTLSCSSANFARLRFRYQSGRLWSQVPTCWGTLWGKVGFYSNSVNGEEWRNS